MSLASLLKHLADVYEPAPVLDRFKQPVAATTLKAAAVPCRLSALRSTPSGELASLTSRDVVRTPWRLFFGPDADVSEADTVKVTQFDGTVLAAALNVVQVRKVSNGSGSTHHVEADCQEVH